MGKDIDRHFYQLRNNTRHITADMQTGRTGKTIGDSPN